MHTGLLPRGKELRVRPSPPDLASGPAVQAAERPCCRGGGSPACSTGAQRTPLGPVRVRTETGHLACQGPSLTNKTVTL